MTIAIRTIQPSEWDHWYGSLESAFDGVAEQPEEREVWERLTECERSLVALEGEETVGTTGAFTFDLTVPGGASVRSAGVTMVSVQPTHRRRGILRSMMRAQLDDIRARGEALAVLTASDPDIYGRFGYGVATFKVAGEIDTARVRLHVPPGTDDVRLRRTTPQDGRAACEAVYARVVPQRPGMLARRPGWEDQPLIDAPGDRGGASPLQCVLAEGADGEVVGYVRYAIRPEWDAAGARGTVVLRDLEALNPAAYAALWRFLFAMDLTSTVSFRNRPVDDPLLSLVSDPRRCRLSMQDMLHLRLVDVGAALEARTYAAPVDVVFEVEDAFCPWNAGRWRLTGDGKGAQCARTEDPAELALSVRELGAAYLGGVSLRALAGAGRVRELRGGALAEASTAFHSDVAPWLPHGF